MHVVHLRDPDSACDIRVFVDGVEVRDVVEINVDPGAGWTRGMWQQAHDEDLSAVHGAGQAVHDAVVAAYDDADGSTYIEEDDE